MIKHPGGRGSNSDEWETPPDLFKRFDAQYGFTLDAAASRLNAKCVRFNSLEEPEKYPWTDEVVWCNPPYSDISRFVARAAERQAKVTVMLLPVRTDTKWFHTYCTGEGVTLRFLRGRVKFLRDGVPMGSPPFASMICIWVKG
jgi:phage N-6-adenine-methyltransferase